MLIVEISYLELFKMKYSGSEKQKLVSFVC